MMTKLQSGQAVLEALILFIACGSFLLALLWLGKVSATALELSNNSRSAAFRLAHQGIELASNDIKPKNWSMRTGSGLLNSSSYQTWQQPAALVGNNKYDYKTSNLFAELKLGDEYIWYVAADAVLGTNTQPADTIKDFDSRRLGLRRFTAIMRGTGVAKSDQNVQLNMANSDNLWRKDYQNSLSIGKYVQNRLDGIDKAWGRSLPNWDWLTSWQASVPIQHLQTGTRP